MQPIPKTPLFPTIPPLTKNNTALFNFLKVDIKDKKAVNKAADHFIYNISRIFVRILREYLSVLIKNN